MENLFKAKLNIKFVRFQLKRNIRFMILATTLMIALYPLLVFTSYVLENGVYNANLFLTGRIFLTIILSASVFIVPFNLFSYLNSKRNLDVYHALPITRKDLYLSTLISSLLIILIPFTLAFLVGGIYNVVAIANVGVILLVKQYVYSVVLAVASLMPVLFAMMNTGTLIDGLLYSAIIHVLPVLGYGAYWLYGEAVLLGFSIGSDQLFLLFTSPLYALFDLNFNIDRTFPNVWLVVLYWSLFSLLATWAILQIYKLRKSEKAETPFTTKWFFPIISTLFMIIVQVFFFSTFVAFNDGRVLDFLTLIFPVVFTFVGYMILDVIANRGFKHFFKGVFNFIVITAITLTAFYSSIATRGVGYITNVPKLESVEQVSFSFSGGNPILSTISSNSYDYLVGYTPNSRTITFSDPKRIETIIDVHQEILDGYKKIDYNKNIYAITDDGIFNEEIYDSYADFSVEYTLDNGSSLIRKYQVRGEWLDNLMAFLDAEEFLNYRYPALNEKTVQVATVRKFDYSSALLNKEQSLLASDKEAFVSAYREDYLSKSAQDHIKTKPIVGFINFSVCISNRCSDTGYPVRSDDQKTLAFLKANNINLIPTTDPNSLYDAALKDNDSRFFLSPSIEQNYYKSDFTVQSLSLNYEEVMQLLPYLEYQTYSDTPRHAIRIQPSPIVSNNFGNPGIIYGIHPDGESVFNKIIEKKDIKTIDFYQFLYTMRE